MIDTLSTSLLAIGLLFGMLIFFEVGRRIGKARLVRHPEGLAKGGGAVEAGIYGLLGLLIAFTFSGGASRFEARRQLVTEEANAIGTGYLRINLLPAAAQPALRQLFREYLDSRLEMYQKLPDIEAAKAELAHSTKLQGDIWTSAIAACRDSGSQAAHMLFLPALNQMIDITTTRLVATQNHPPLVIYLMLIALCLIGSLLAGYDMSESKDRSWFHMVVFAAMLSLAVYVIVDLEYPRLGLIRIDAADQTLIELRKSLE
jgi:hypothetical protein